MKTVNIFLASSSELNTERNDLAIFISNKNKLWVSKGFYFALKVWENLGDEISTTRKQDDYNKVIEESDIFLILFFNKVGKYSVEEFDIAYKNFKEKGNPLVFTYFKTANLNTQLIKPDDINSTFAFQDKLDSLDHFKSTYKDSNDLQNKFYDQLEQYIQKTQPKNNEIDQITKNILFPINSNLKSSISLVVNSNELQVKPTTMRLEKKIEAKVIRGIECSQNSKLDKWSTKHEIIDTMYFLSHDDMPRFTDDQERLFYNFLNYLSFDIFFYKDMNFDINYFLKYSNKVGSVLPPDFKFRFDSSYYINNPTVKNQNNGVTTYFEKTNIFKLDSNYLPINPKSTNSITNIYNLINSTIVLEARIHPAITASPIIPLRGGSFIKMELPTSIIDFDILNLNLSYINQKKLELFNFEKKVNPEVIYFFKKIDDTLSWDD